MKVELYSEHPRQPLETLIQELIAGATSVDIAVAFISGAGAAAIESIVAQMNDRGKVSFVVSVMFPTDLDAIAGLAGKLGNKIDIWIHLGFKEVLEEKLHGQFHSKLMLIQKGD